MRSYIVLEAVRPRVPGLGGLGEDVRLVVAWDPARSSACSPIPRAAARMFPPRRAWSDPRDALLLGELPGLLVAVHHLTRSSRAPSRRPGLSPSPTPQGVAALDSGELQRGGLFCPNPRPMLSWKVVFVVIWYGFVAPSNCFVMARPSPGSVPGCSHRAWVSVSGPASTEALPSATCPGDCRQLGSAAPTGIDRHQLPALSLQVADALGENLGLGRRVPPARTSSQNFSSRPAISLLTSSAVSCALLLLSW